MRVRVDDERNIVPARDSANMVVGRRGGNQDSSQSALVPKRLNRVLEKGVFLVSADNEGMVICRIHENGVPVLFIPMHPLSH